MKFFAYILNFIDHIRNQKGSENITSPQSGQSSCVNDALDARPVANGKFGIKFSLYVFDPVLIMTQ